MRIQLQRRLRREFRFLQLALKGVLLLLCLATAKPQSLEPPSFNMRGAFEPLQLGFTQRSVPYRDGVTRFHYTDPPDFAPMMEDSVRRNLYGDLRDDNPRYVHKSSILMAAFRVTMANASTLAIDRYLFNYDFARVGFNSWRHNFKTGWEWDTDRFSMNYFFHPYSGAMYYNAARANGFSFFESVPFAYLGSLEWEYLGENTLPSYNDVINTPVNGIFLGEIFYRLGSNILDDGTTGWNRFGREFAVALITPTRFLSRLMNGDLARTTTEQVYQQEPLNMALSVGYHRVNDGTSLEHASNSVNINFHMDYGSPFEHLARKPFDFFKLRTDFDFGVGRKIIDNITGYGILYGRNVQVTSSEWLFGLFQHMNFYNNKTFELGTMGFGPGMLSQIPTGKSSNLITGIHIAAVPFAGLSTRFGPDTTQLRDYNYGGGAEVILEAAYDFGAGVSIACIGYYWWFHTYVGIPGNSYIGLVKPRILFRLTGILSIGAEHLIYYSDRYPRDFAPIHSVRTEQKLFLELNFQEFRFTRKVIP